MTKSKPLAVSYERCHELLEICAQSPLRLEDESGLKWRVNQGSAKANNWAGDVMKVKKNNKTQKYWRIMIDDRRYLISRIVYFMSHGVDPYPMEVDHIDRNSLNNSIYNLRTADDILQGQNQGMRSNNKSGVKGVSWHKQASKWQSHIWIKSKSKYLGLYATLREAAEARNAAVRKHWPEEVWEANLIDLDSLPDCETTPPTAD